MQTPLVPCRWGCHDDDATMGRRPPTIRSVEVTIVDVEAEGRYEARVDGDPAGTLAYVLKQGRIALVHTEVLEVFRGRGIAGQLAQFALDDARRRGLRVIAVCPYVRGFVERHPETLDIVEGMPDAAAATGST